MAHQTRVLRQKYAAHVIDYRETRRCGRKQKKGRKGILIETRPEQKQYFDVHRQHF